MTSRGVTARRATTVLLTVVLAGCSSGKFSSSGHGKHSAAELRAQLAKLSSEADEFLGGGPAAFKAQVSALRGIPIVVNQWASWCGPCRYEFPFFQTLSRRYRGRVAFLGVDSQDAESDAQAFVKKYPVPYPHFFDEDVSIARLFGGGRAWPTTAYYDAAGKLTNTHPGAYANEGKLDADIRRHALHG